MNKHMKKLVHSEPKEDDYLLYRYVYKPTGETVYVGMTIDKKVEGNSRDSAHRCKSKNKAPLDKALKIDPNNYQFLVIGYVNKEYIEMVEMYYIARYKTYYYWYKNERERAFNRDIGGPIRKQLSVKVVTEEFRKETHRRSVEAKRKNGSLKSGAQKALKTKRERHDMHEIAMKGVETRRKRGTDIIGVQKTKETKESKGIYKIAGKKLSKIKKGSQKAREAAAKATATKRANNTYKTAAEKMLLTRKANGTDKTIGPKMAATRRANDSFKSGARKAADTKLANGQTKRDAMKALKTRQSSPDYEKYIERMVEGHKKNGVYKLMASIRRQPTEVILENGEIKVFESRNEAASYIGMASSYISSILTGKRKPGMRLQKKLKEKGIADIREGHAS